MGRNQAKGIEQNTGEPLKIVNLKLLVLFLVTMLMVLEVFVCGLVTGAILTLLQVLNYMLIVVI